MNILRRLRIFELQSFNGEAVVFTEAQCSGVDLFLARADYRRRVGKNAVFRNGQSSDFWTLGPYLTAVALRARAQPVIKLTLDYRRLQQLGKELFTLAGVLPANNVEYQSYDLV